MNGAATFWWLLTLAALVWYSTVTVYVTIRGAADIRGMLARLGRRHAEGRGPLPPETECGQENRGGWG